MSHYSGIYPQQTQNYQSQQQQQEEALIEYYVYQDLQNLINLLYSRKAVLEHFQNNPNDPMVTVSNNKIILQLNISSGIHQDLQYQYQTNNYLRDKLKQERKNAFSMLKTVNENLNSQAGTQNQQYSHIKDPIETYLNQFMNNYESGQFGQNQFQLLNTNSASQFNEQVVSKIISSIQTIDAQTNQIRRDGSYQIPTSQLLQQRAQDYYLMTKDKLNQTDPQNYQSQFNNKYENGQSQQSQFLDIKNQHSLTSQNSQQQYNLTNQNINSEKEKLIQFFNLLGYFNQTGTQTYFWKEVENLQNQVNQFLKNEEHQQFPERQFAKKLSELKRFYNQQIILHQYFELFFNLMQQMINSQKALSNEMLNSFITKNRIKGTITENFFSYLFNQKEMIEKYLAQKQQINNIHNISFTGQRDQFQTNQKISEVDYIWYMYQGFCYYYYGIQRRD